MSANPKIENLFTNEVLHNKSLECIDIDLGDGVKVNYAKFEGWWGRYEFRLFPVKVKDFIYFQLLIL